MLLAFLGNPEKKYEYTRHNAAWILCDKSSFFRQVSWQHKFKGLYAQARCFQSEVVHVLKPQTFMNLSGQSVADALVFFKLTGEDLLVVHDELELPLGVLSLKWAGGLGGHNGLRSLKAECGTADFWRLRIGIGRPNHSDIAGYVLSPFTSSEYEILLSGVVLFDLILENFFKNPENRMHLVKKYHKVLYMEKK